jgi:hypothetical protein
MNHGISNILDDAFMAPISQQIAAYYYRRVAIEPICIPAQIASVSGYLRHKCVSRMSRTLHEWIDPTCKLYRTEIRMILASYLAARQYTPLFEIDAAVCDECWGSISLDDIRPEYKTTVINLDMYAVCCAWHM